MSVIGGGSRSHWWGEVIASVMSLPLTYRMAAEVGPAFGAARLARLCVTGEDYENICTQPPVSHIIEPNQDLQSLYSERRELFSKLYNVTKELN